MVLAAANEGIRLDLGWVDYLMIIVYFAVVIGIGFTARKQVRTSMDFFLSGRSMPAWITGLAFVSANLGATEILGMAANGAQIGMATLHYYLVGAVPAMVFLGLVMMPFYYGSKVRSVPEFMLRRFGKAPHLVNAIAFAVSNVLIAGINLYAMAIVIEAMLGWPEWLAIIVSAGFVLVYITLGGLSSAIYNEVMQFFVIIAGLIPLTIVGLHRVGGWDGLSKAITETQGVQHLQAWAGTGFGDVTNPIGANWLAIVLGLGFVLGFGYWTTNFTEVQRAFSAKNMSAARRTPLIAAIPKLFIPAIVVIPGLIAAAVVGNQFADGTLTYNDAIPKLIQMYLPTGVLGIAVTGLLASFMAGMAANVSSFNTVFTYDIWQRYIRPNMPDLHYLKTGRWVTVVGVVVGIATAFIAAQASNIMTYMQTLFSFFNAPLFAVFILGLLWKRMTTQGALWGYVLGIVTPTITWIAYLVNPDLFATATAETLYGAIISFVTVLVVGFVVSMLTKPKDEKELGGLVYGVGKIDLHGDSVATDTAWYRSPALLGTVALVLCVVLYLPFL
ncbi:MULTISPECIES: sodium:solute symporter family protein [Curtobacterium]|jgi:SSS family solute:Na+ symporter|uniref:sodium:solute symporter family protein n=1 Tax=Curtobacterium TaxID=2034 RepID=UPI0008F8FB8A|nr:MULTISPECIES: sodium:solute symporter family protein [Curtobacterium]MBB1198333.1 Na+/galactose cotransporter [Curtobacterium flaccumfaciens]MBF4627048.1 sodium:solute symporter family protein [Curtobacterium flaccumfaciens]MBO9039645.1 sodium:solute symporter family protein [Curtobacterium flaccumfaciens pv. flaccumfaciens]MBO9044516.1 sodium:solute symporter family protein [Curtobacterium flaccumfaciens pv. flaccumfaciens]MBO9050444.1 sodium:solute symporter family protein [Curtobacterium